MKDLYRAWILGEVRKQSQCKANSGVGGPKGVFLERWPAERRWNVSLWKGNTMRTRTWLVVGVVVWVVGSSSVSAAERRLSRAELEDKIAGFWIGQLAGNYMGFPFENVYEAEPCPFLVDRYYTWRDDPAIRMNREDLRGFVPIFAGAFEGAFSDDDTDIELVTLHAVETYGLDLTYPEITSMWKKHINRKIWVANRTARNLMEKG